VCVQVDLQLESGEYFLKPAVKKRREEHERRQKACVFLFGVRNTPMTFLHCPQQGEATAKRRMERAEAFVAPVEMAAPTVEEKRKRKRRELTEMNGDEVANEGTTGKRKKKKRAEDELL
jgi:ribosomal RNA assembly protein